MPVDYDRYPPDWKAISVRIRARDGNVCKFCGVPNGATILRSVEDSSRYLVVNDQGEHSYPGGGPLRLSEIPAEFNVQTKYTVVVLTVAHLDHTTTNNADENLASLCNRCHLLHDLEVHVRHARQTRLRKKQETIIASGQLALPFQEDNDGQGA